MSKNKLEDITEYLDKYEKDRMILYEYLLYLGEELIDDKDLDIFDTKTNIEGFLETIESKKKLDTDFIDELLKFSNEVVEESELKVVQNTSIYLELDSEITYSFLILSVAYTILFNPDVVLIKKGVKEYERYILSYYHSLGEDTFVTLSEYVPQDENKTEFGLYTKRDFKKGDKVSYFYGDVIPVITSNRLEKWSSKYIGEYNLYISKDKLFHIRIKSPIEGNAHYANCALKKKDINAKISCNTSKDKKKVYLIATKNINAGEEILTDYGDEYRKAIIEGEI